MESRKPIPTLNRCGFQMEWPSALVEEWISAYDNVHPLLDVGCAFGINTFEALRRGIPTIALDMEERHLDFIRENLTSYYKPLATCVFGSLPNNIPIPDHSISGILASEVFHFLKGSEVTEALTILHKKLLEGGILAFTVLSDELLKFTVSKEKQDLFYNSLSNGEKWPGTIKVDEEFLGGLSNYKTDDMIMEFERHLPEYLQVFSQRQMVDALESIGFQIKMSKYVSYPDDIGKLEGINLQVVAEKRRAVREK